MQSVRDLAKLPAPKAVFRGSSEVACPNILEPMKLVNSNDTVVQNQ